MSNLMAFWLGFSLTLIWPLKRLQFRSDHWVNWPISVLYALLWPLWIMLLVRKLLLEAMLRDEL